MKKESNKSHISYSSISAFQCPYRYFKIYIDKTLKRESILMQTGKIIHECINEYSDACIKLKLESDYEVMQKTIKTALSKESVTSEQEIEIRETLLEFAENNIGYDKLLDHEIDAFIPLDSNDKFVEVIIDRTNAYRDNEGARVLEIIDYKHSYLIMTAVEVDNSLQLKIYEWAALKQIYKNYDKIRKGIYNTRYGFIRYGKMRNVADLGKEIEGMDNYLNEQWIKIKEAKDYPCIKSEACTQYGGCPLMLSGECPEYSKDQIEKILRSDDIIELVRTVRMLELQIDEAKAKIKQHFSTNGPIEVDGKKVEAKYSFSYKYLFACLNFIKEKYKLNLDEIEIGKKEVEDILKKAFGKNSLENYIAELEPYKIPTSSSRFEI
jgi:hypothetical protein